MKNKGGGIHLFSLAWRQKKKPHCQRGSLCALQNMMLNHLIKFMHWLCTFWSKKRM